jgi:hypothetical protein
LQAATAQHADSLSGWPTEQGTTTVRTIVGKSARHGARQVAGLSLCIREERAHPIAPEAVDVLERFQKDHDGAERRDLIVLQFNATPPR